MPVLSKFLLLCRLGGFGAASPAASAAAALAAVRRGVTGFAEAGLAAAGLAGGFAVTGLSAVGLAVLRRAPVGAGLAGAAPAVTASPSATASAGAAAGAAASASAAGAAAAAAAAVAAVSASRPAGLVTVVSVTVSDAPGVRARGTSWCEALFLSLSVISSNWPMPAKTPRSAWAGASLMRSLTCGTRMSHSPSRTGYHVAPGQVPSICPAPVHR